jgi:uncharacterized ubiquitin-like protein YukD
MENKTITVNIEYFGDDKEYELTISINLTIKHLRNSIEDLLHIRIKKPLKLKKAGRAGLVNLDDEEKTIEQYRIHSDDIIPIYREDFLGRKKK